MNYTKKERERYNKDRENACEKLGIEKKDYNYLRLQGEKFRKLAELGCNGEIEEADYTKQADELEKKIQKRAFGNGLSYFIQTDPRGGAVYVAKEQLDDLNYNANGTLIF